jgi:hypothetical protein
MFLILTRVAADFAAGRTYFASWNGGGHFIASTAVAGQLYTGESGGIIKSTMSVTMAPNKWYCVFLTYTSATKIHSWYCNGAKSGPDTAYVSNVDHIVADPITCLGGVNGYGGWTANTDYLECAVWGSVLTPAMVVEETNRLSSLYGITLN